jgi:hypothetical protein
VSDAQSELEELRAEIQRLTGIVARLILDRQDLRERLTKYLTGFVAFVRRG